MRGKVSIIKKNILNSINTVLWGVDNRFPKTIL